MTERDHLPLEPTPEMIVAGADALEHVNAIGRWLAESLATAVLERAFEEAERGRPQTAPGLRRGGAASLDASRGHDLRRS